MSLSAVGSTYTKKHKPSKNEIPAGNYAKMLKKENILKETWNNKIPVKSEAARGL